MAALNANPFDDLLSSHSVFVSPNMMKVGDAHSAAHRYGHHADDRYNSHTEDLDGNKSLGSHNQSGEGARWGGQQDDYTGGCVEESLVDDPRRELAHTKVQKAHQHQQQHAARGQGNGAAASPPDQLHEEDNVGGWEERTDGGAVVGRGGSFDDDSSWQAPDFHRRSSSVTGLDDDDTTLVRLDDAPSPTAAAAAATAAEPEPWPASRSFEDQPIRGMVGGKEMSLDELIAQGERQMQEAQAKTASAKPAAIAAAATRSRPKIPPVTLVAASPPDATPATATTARRKSAMNSSTERSHSNDPNGSRRGPAVRHSTEIGGTLGGVARDGGGGGSGVEGGLRSSVTSATGGGGWGGGRSGSIVGGGGGGLRASTSARSASFATSWSGGDPEQLQHISMGVVPATGGEGVGRGDPAERREGESREERERREFYELEMELLREEEGAEREWGEQGEGGRGLGRDGQEEGDFWGGEREGYKADRRGEADEGRRETLTERPGYRPPEASNERWVSVVSLSGGLCSTKGACDLRRWATVCGVFLCPGPLCFRFPDEAYFFKYEHAAHAINSTLPINVVHARYIAFDIGAIRIPCIYCCIPGATQQTELDCARSGSRKRVLTGKSKSYIRQQAPL